MINFLEKSADFEDSGFVKTCNELVIETPIVSRQPSMIIDPAKLDSRYNSDPNLASQQEKKSSINGIPDYNAPPPNSAINPQVSHTPKVIKSSNLYIPSTFDGCIFMGKTNTKLEFIYNSSIHLLFWYHSLFCLLYLEISRLSR